MALPRSDGLVKIRAPRDDDLAQLISGRDSESERWLGPGSPEPSPTVVIEVDDVVVGWVDADASAEWLGTTEINVGYCVFGEHRSKATPRVRYGCSHGELRLRNAGTALLVIDEHNTHLRS